MGAVPAITDVAVPLHARSHPFIGLPLLSASSANTLARTTNSNGSTSGPPAVSGENLGAVAEPVLLI